MKKIYLAGLALSMFFTSFGQDCSNGRYKDEIFSGFTLTSDVQYGSNINNQGADTDLLVDIREPEGDTETSRPLILLMHGGTFIGGSKTGDDVVPLAEEFARKGYVTASISYRLGMDNLLSATGPSEGDASEAVFRATQDLKAAIRFFYKSVEDDGNPYGIDTDHIYLVGSSAGGFMAVHHAYLNEEADIPASIDFSKPGLTGGIEGESGNAGYSTDVTAVVNMAGALGDADWIEAGDLPILSLHGDQDGTVPYGTDIITVAIFEIIEVDGSQTIHAKAEELGLKNCFKTFKGADHVPHVSDANYYDTTANYITNFLLHFVCDAEDFCKYDASLSTQEEVLVDFNMYPNPAVDKVNISTTDLIEAYTIYSLNGQAVASESNINSNYISIDSSPLKSGMYIVHIKTPEGIGTQKLVIE